MQFAVCEKVSGDDHEFPSSVLLLIIVAALVGIVHEDDQKKDECRAIDGIVVPNWIGWDCDRSGR